MFSAVFSDLKQCQKYPPTPGAVSIIMFYNDCNRTSVVTSFTSPTMFLRDFYEIYPDVKRLSCVIIICLFHKPPRRQLWEAQNKANPILKQIVLVGDDLMTSEDF